MVETYRGGGINLSFFGVGGCMVCHSLVFLCCGGGSSGWYYIVLNPHLPVANLHVPYEQCIVLVQTYS